MFRFTIRDVLWLMVVVGMGVALWQSRRELDKEREQGLQWALRSEAAISAVRRSGAEAKWYDNGIVVNETDAATGQKRVYIFVGRAK